MRMKRIPGLRKSVYLMVGLEIGKGVTVQKNRKVDFSVEAKTSAKVPFPVAEAGAKGVQHANRCPNNSKTFEEDVIFGYQLFKTEVQGFEKEIVVTEFSQPSGGVIQ